MPFVNSPERGSAGQSGGRQALSDPYGTALVPVMPRRFPSSVPLRTVCRAVSQITAEMLFLLGDRVIERRDRRRPSCHVRQIAMYVCHVALQMTQAEIGTAFGRDRTTVGHACHVVEDRRDDAAFDEFVSAIERMATAVFASQEFAAYE
jgi:hypothetical protein